MKIGAVKSGVKCLLTNETVMINERVWKERLTPANICLISEMPKTTSHEILGM